MNCARFVSAPENRAGLLAVQRVAACVVAGRPRRVINPLFLHGPPGCGKTHLVSVLAEDVSRQTAPLAVNVLAAGDLAELAGGAAGAEAFAGLRHGDLLVIEDLQHLPARHAEALLRLLDELVARQTQVVVTASVGPARLSLPARLTSRLAAGLVVGLEPLQPASRLKLLADKAQRRQLAVSRDVLAWLAEHLTGGGRQLEGALNRLEVLARLQARPLDVATVAEQFREQADAGQPTVDRIAQRVGGHFRVKADELCSRRRNRAVMLPRQVGMYLARQLTRLSLDQIGAYFGGRDHSTVLHACRKVEQALADDPALSGTVRQLQAGLM